MTNNLQFGSVAEEMAINESQSELRKDSLFEATATVGEINEPMTNSSVMPAPQLYNEKLDTHISPVEIKVNNLENQSISAGKGASHDGQRSTV